jgi:hypothetical protein
MEMSSVQVRQRQTAVLKTAAQGLRESSGIDSLTFANTADIV